MSALLEAAKEYGPSFLQWICTIVVGAVGGIGAVRLHSKMNKRVIANLQRPVMVIGTRQNGMTDQHRLLERVGLFNVEKLFETDKAVDFVASAHRLLVLGYSPDNTFMQLFEVARNNRIPVLIFASQGQISQDDFRAISEYMFASVCNTNLRLVSDVFALMCTFPEK